MKELNEIKEKELQELPNDIKDRVSIYLNLFNREFESEDLKKEYITVVREQISLYCKSLLRLLESYEEQYDLPDLQTED